MKEREKDAKREKIDIVSLLADVKSRAGRPNQLTPQQEGDLVAIRFKIRATSGINCFIMLYWVLVIPYFCVKFFDSFPVVVFVLSLGTLCFFICLGLICYQNKLYDHSVALLQENEQEEEDEEFTPIMSSYAHTGRQKGDDS